MERGRGGEGERWRGGEGGERWRGGEKLEFEQAKVLLDGTHPPPLIQSEGAYSGDMCPHLAVDTGTLDAQHTSMVDGCPLRVWKGRMAE